MSHRNRSAAARLGSALVLVLVCAGSACAQEAGRPKLLLDAKGTDCTACHGSSNPLPQSHPSIVGKSLSDCAMCHAAGTGRELLGYMPLFHAHLLSGLTCASCHTDPKAPQPTEGNSCMGCHDPDKVSAGTAAVRPANPHNSPHYGKTTDCNLCHHQHEKSENYCSQCHSNFNFNVP